jgi:hypothetical protein
MTPGQSRQSQAANQEQLEDIARDVAAALKSLPQEAPESD